MLLIPMLSMHAVATTFYVNPASLAANDLNAGTDPAAPWMSLNPTKWVEGSIVMLSPGVHIVLTMADVNANVTLQGASKSNTIIEGLSEDDMARGSESPRFFQVTGNNMLTLKDITIRNFASTADLWGGMFNVSSTSTLTLLNVDIKNAKLPIRGGAAIYSDGTINLTNVSIENCISAIGAAISIQGLGVATLENVKFKNNSTDDGTPAYKFGGAICINTPTAVVNINNSYFDSNTCANDITNPGFNYPTGGAIAFRVAGGCNAKLHIKNSTFSKNFAGWSGGAIMIDKMGDFTSTGNVDLLFTNNTFIENYVNAVHGQVFAIGGGDDANMKGSISFVNNTFMHNGKTTENTSMFFNSIGVSLNYINNILRDQVWSVAQQQFIGYGFVLNNGGNNYYTSLTFKGNVWDAVGGWLQGTTYDQIYSSDNIFGMNAVDSLLTIPNVGVPYLAINNVNSIAVDKGISEFMLNSINIVPSVDVRGSAMYGAKKDAGAYEYNPDLTSINNPMSETKMFAYPNPFTDVIYLNKEVASISVYDLAGKKRFSASNVSKINVANLQTGLYIVSIVNPDGTVLTQKLQK